MAEGFRTMKGRETVPAAVRHRAVVVLALAVAVLSLTGCPDKYPACTSDEQCRDHDEYCVDKVCRECAEDGHCTKRHGNPCLTCGAQNSCQPVAGCCRTDLDCPGGKCWKEAGQEKGYCSECEADANCPGKDRCVKGRCVVATQVGNADASGGCQPGQKRVNGQCVWPCQFKTIYFDFNEHELTESARQDLDANARCATELGVAVEIWGHTDERGTEEYNLALGERRAVTARGFLKDRGVTVPMRTLSYGEEAPLCTDSNENCWKKNRRAEFRPEE